MAILKSFKMSPHITIPRHLLIWDPKIPKNRVALIEPINRLIGTFGTINRVSKNRDGY